MKKITLIVNGESREVVVHKLGLRKFAEVLRLLQGATLNEISSWDGKSNDDVIASLPVLIASSMEQVAKILELAVGGLTHDEIMDDLDLADVTMLMAAVIEVNRVQDIVANLKFLVAKVRPPVKK